MNKLECDSCVKKKEEKEEEKQKKCTMETRKVKVGRFVDAICCHLIQKIFT